MTKTSALDMLRTIGEAKSGTRFLVAEAFDAVNAHEGGTIRLPFGTEIETSLAIGNSISAVAAIDGELRRVYIFAEQYHCLAEQRTK